MKNPRVVVSLVLVLLLAFPCVTTAEVVSDPSIEETNQLIEGYIAEGMTIKEIAAATYQNNSDALSAYSDNFLKLLIALLEIELQHRGFAQGEVVVPMGEYIVGEDIPAGTYTLTAYGNLTDIEVYSNGKCIHDHCLTSSEQVGKLPLEDGQVVRIKYGSMIFAPYKGLGF